MTRILRPKESMARLGIGHTKFYADIKAKRLPQLVHLGPRCVGHIEEELEAYIERLKAERDERTCSSAWDRRSRPLPAVTS